MAAQDDLQPVSSLLIHLSTWHTSPLIFSCELCSSANCALTLRSAVDLPTTPQLEQKKLSSWQQMTKSLDQLDMNKVFASLLRVAPDEVQQLDQTAHVRGATAQKVPKASFVSATSTSKSGIDIRSNIFEQVKLLAADVGDSGKSKLDAWFDELASRHDDLRRPVYALSEKTGVIPEKNMVKDLNPEEGDEPEPEPEPEVDIEGFETDDADDPQYGFSPHHGCLVLLKGRPILPYPESVINDLGNQAASHFSTTVSFIA